MFYKFKFATFIDIHAKLFENTFLKSNNPMGFSIYSLDIDVISFYK